MKNLWLIALISIALGSVSCLKENPAAVYTVRFDAGGGSPVPDVQTLKAGDKVIAPATNPAKAGYVFLFWHLNEAATAYDFNTPVNGDMTLQAKWTAEAGAEYWQVAWNLNGGSWPPDDNHATQVVKGGTLAEPAPPVKAGGAFDGWYKEAALTNKATFPYDVSATRSNLAFYAKWITENGGGPSSGAYNVSNATEWNAAVAAVNAAGNNQSHTFTITKSFSLPGTSVAMFDKDLTGITVNIRGQGSSIPEISLAGGSTGCLIYCNKKMVLENVALKGHAANTAPLVYINYNNEAELVLETGASIAGNTNTEGDGGGVFAGNKLVLKGGRISGNTAGTSAKSNGKGGGVYLPDLAELIMEHGSAINGNLAYGQGGGVYVGFSAEFAMKGGEIFSNTARVVSKGGRGGGVYTFYGKFYMGGGKLAGYDAAHGDNINIVEHNPIDPSLRDSCNAVIITARVMGVYGAALYSQVSGDNFYGRFDGDTFIQTGSLGSRRERHTRVIDGVLQP